MAFEIRVDCPSCCVEGTRIEQWDNASTSCRLGVAESARCRLCGHTAVGRVIGVENPAPGEGCPGCGATLEDEIRDAHRCPFCGTHALLEDTQGPRKLATVKELEASLDTWAREEGFTRAQDLLDSYFALPTVQAIFESLSRGERVETTFDVADYLFSGGGAGGGGEPAVMREEEEEPPSTQRVPHPTSLRKVGGPREELLALASVAAADGEASRDDQMVLERAAGKRGIPLLQPEDVRVWRPNEIDPPPTLVDRERVLEEMFQMAWSDGQLDESEMRVIRDFARAWGIDPERLKEWTELYSFGDSNKFERWFRRIGLFLFPAR